jgi:uncharacterized alpha-E superfamily protein
MLSSVASRCYWTARYLERAENTARLIDVYSTLLLDLPPATGISWHQLITTCGATELFAEAATGAPTEKRVVQFMAADPGNPVSIVSSVNDARENLRTLRDIVPREGFELVNEFYRFANSQLSKSTSVRVRNELLKAVIQYCQQLTGLFAGTMNHTESYQFLRLGRNLERADMTTRILDVAGELLSSSTANFHEHETTLWVNVLRSTSGYQAYRQSVRSRITPARVVFFLLADSGFPRSVAHCLEEIRSAALQLPNNTEVLAGVESIKNAMTELSLRELVRESLHREMDNLQSLFIEFDSILQTHWFATDQANLS